MLNDTVYWSNTAVKELESIVRFIASDSVCHAGELTTDIFCQLEKAVFNPKHFPPDKYKRNNDGSYRAFEVHRHRIVYRISGDVIKVLRIRHTSRAVLEY